VHTWLHKTKTWYIVSAREVDYSEYVRMHKVCMFVCTFSVLYMNNKPGTPQSSVPQEHNIMSNRFFQVNLIC